MNHSVVPGMNSQEQLTKSPIKLLYPSNNLQLNKRNISPLSHETKLDSVLKFTSSSKRHIAKLDNLIGRKSGPRKDTLVFGTKIVNSSIMRNNHSMLSANADLLLGNRTRRSIRNLINDQLSSSKISHRSNSSSFSESHRKHLSRRLATPIIKHIEFSIRYQSFLPV